MGSAKSPYESVTGIGAEICPRIDLVPGLDFAIGFGLAAAEDDEDFQGMLTLGQKAERRAAFLYVPNAREVLFCRWRGSS